MDTKLTVGPEPWDQQPGESAKAYRAWRAYLDLGVERTLQNAADIVGNHRRMLDNWSSQWKWVERLRLHSNHLDRVRQAAEDAELAKHAAKWEKRRLEDLDLYHDASRLLYKRSLEMIAFPLATRRVKEKDDKGNTVTVEVKATKWTMATAGQFMKHAAELAQSSTAGALEEKDDFDAGSATLDECRAYVDRQEARRKARNVGKGTA